VLPDYTESQSRKNRMNHRRDNLRPYTRGKEVPTPGISKSRDS